MVTVSDLLLIRADGGELMGTGHVMRCLALAQGWQRTGRRVIFAQAESTPALERRLSSDGIEVVRFDVIRGSLEDAAQTAELAKERRASIIADGYCFGTTWQREIRNSGLWLLLWDDYGQAEHYYADLILNQNLHASPQMYLRREPYTRLLLGTRYAQLRREFLDWRNLRRDIPAFARKVLVTLGGSDPDNATAKVMQALARVREVEAVVVVVGGSNRNLAFLQSTSMSDQSSPIRLLVDAPNMPQLMAWADIAITAGGSTCWEAAFMGLPSIVVPIADNQKPVAKALAHHGIACVDPACASFHDQLANAVQTLVSAPAEDRSSLSHRLRRLVDGQGASRVAQLLRAGEVILRPVSASDRELVWGWANDLGVRRSAFRSEPIPWDNHVRWFDSKCGSPECVWYMACDAEQNPVGQIRIDLDTERNGKIDISVSPDQRGRGLGTSILCAAVQEAFTTTAVRTLHAYVKPENALSLRTFDRAGFQNIGMDALDGHPAVHFIATEAVFEQRN